MHELQRAHNLRLEPDQRYVALEQFLRSLRLTALQADLCEGRYRRCALRIAINRILDERFSSGKVIAPLQYRERLVHHREHVDRSRSSRLAFNRSIEFFDGVFETLLLKQNFAAMINMLRHQ